jgi:hypothetical protein
MSFDPFVYVPLFGPRHGTIDDETGRPSKGIPAWKTRQLWWLIPLFAGLVLIVNLADGTLGTLADFQLWEDTKRLTYGLTDPTKVSDSDPYFPLVRDAGSWFLAFTIVFGTFLLHRQWRLIADALPAMRRSGTIVPRDEPLKLNRFTRLIGIDRKVRGCEPHEALDEFVRKTAAPSPFKRVLTMLTLGVLAIVLAQALRMGERRGIFSLLAPGAPDAARPAEWQQEAYRTWWASEEVFLGGALYFLFAVFAILLILSFNTAGLLSVYMAVALRFVAHVGADWWNRDGRYGWRPVAEIFRTVRLAVTLLAATLSVTVLLLGPKHITWIVWLVVLYLASLPFYTIAPWAVFRRVARTARERRIAALENEMRERKIDPQLDILAAAPFLAEIDRCWAAQIRPLRLGRQSFSAFAPVWLLPLALTILQIVFAA